MKTVYVAGAMNSDNILGVLENIQRGICYGGQVLKLGLAPFVPHLDVFFKMLGGEDLNIPMQHYYNYTMEFLTKCDYVLVCSKYENSKGTLAEIEKAKELNMPIFYSLEELKEYMNW